MSILNVTFSTASQGKGAYEYKVVFQRESAIEETLFKIFQHSVPQKGEILDVYSLNGTLKNGGANGGGSTRVLKHILHKGDLEDVQKAISIFPLYNVETQRVFVLDLQDTHTKYRPCLQCPSLLETNELIVADFLRTKPTEKERTSDTAYQQIRTLLQAGNVQFMIGEGSIKRNLLEHGGFTPDQMDFLLNEKGGSSFCQTAEFVMNAFKFGQAVKCGDGFELHGDAYIKAIGPAHFIPGDVSTVLYPSFYKEVYNETDSRYVKAITNVFHSAAHTHSNGIFALTLTGK